MPNQNRLRSKSHKGRRAPVSRSEPMKAQYDFSIAERGRFYYPNAVFSFPVYLEPELNDFLTKLAGQKKVDIQQLVNDLLRADMKLIQSLQ